MLHESSGEFSEEENKLQVIGSGTVTLFCRHRPNPENEAGGHARYY
jgi:hypothetical protein